MVASIPGGDEFEQWRCNTTESGKNTTTPVGTYLAGASPCTAQDMAGNVWEWTDSLYRRYFYQEADRRNTSDPAEYRVLRSCSWEHDAKNARAARRCYEYPDSFHPSLASVWCGQPPPPDLLSSRSCVTQAGICGVPREPSIVRFSQSYIATN